MRGGAMITFTVWNQRTGEVFGRGLTVEDARQFFYSKAIEVDHESAAEIRRDDPGSDLMMLRTNPAISAVRYANAREAYLAGYGTKGGSSVRKAAKKNSKRKVA
jgi:hypothetical protein